MLHKCPSDRSGPALEGGLPVASQVSIAARALEGTLPREESANQRPVAGKSGAGFQPHVMKPTSLPVQYRELKIDPKKVDADSRTVDILFSTDAPAQRWFGKEILDHSPGACDLSRLNDGGAFLKDHDNTKQIGVHEPGTARTVIANGRGEGRATVRFAGPTNPLAQQEFQDVLDGVRTKISVGYIVQEMEMVDDDDNDGDEVYKVTKWQPLENSLVSIPLDAAAGVGRANDGTEYAVTIKRNRSMENPTQTTTEPTPRTRAATPRTAEQERERIREIQAIAKRCRIPEDEVEQAINDGMSDRAFRKLCFENYWGNAEPLVTPGEGDYRSSTDSAHRGSPSIASAVQRSGEFAKFRRSGGRRSMNVDIPDVYGIRTLTTASAGLTGIDKLPGVVALGQQQLLVADLLSQSETSMPTVRYIRENSFTNGATTVLEGNLKPNADLDLGEQDAPVRKIAVTSKLPDEVIQDWPQVEEFLNNRLGYMVGRVADSQILSGNGTAPNMLGILNGPGLLASVRGADTALDAIFKGITRIQAESFFQPDGLVMHPTDYQNLRLMKDANNQYFGAGPFFAPYGNGMIQVMADRVWNLPVVKTVSIAQGTVLIGAFKIGASLFWRKGLSLEISSSNEDDFKRNLVCVRAEMRAALALFSPQAFLQLTL